MKFLLALAAVSLAWGQVHRVPTSTQWYPSDAAALEKLLDDSFALAAKRTGGGPHRRHLAAIIAPHAALPFSGAIAAAAYSRLNQPGNVIVLGFSHSRRIDGIAAPDLDAYSTPIGKVRVNRDVIRELKVAVLPQTDVGDHSIENQLPFIRRVAPEASVTPLIVGEMVEPQMKVFARKLSSRIGKGDVIVASSDFTHYGKEYRYEPFPKDDQLPKRLFERALAVFERIGSLDARSFDRIIEETGDTTCGRGPVRLLMEALAGQGEPHYLQALDYLASGALTRDYSLSVSYGALAFYPARAFEVDAAEQKKLLRSARRTLEAFLATGAKLPEPVPSEERNGELSRRTGVFVTIKTDGRLRGCVGALTPQKPLWEAVADRTLVAATQDPRFKPVSRKEGPFTLEISLLTPLRKLSSWRDFRLGQGAVLVLDGKSGLLLPQVAAENNWSREQFLENLALKAGLPARAYRDRRSALYSYSAQVFSE
jgi:MEMO1 family protein